MKRKQKIAIVIVAIATVFALFRYFSSKELDFFLELNVQKEVIEVSSLDSDETRQRAMLQNLLVTYYSNNEEKQWYRATELNGVVSGNRTNFTYNGNGFNFVVTVSNETVNVVAEKGAATSSISFIMKEVEQGSNSGNSVSKPGKGVGFENGITEAERNHLREEAASDNNAQDLDKDGNVVGIQNPENIWMPDNDTIIIDEDGDYHLGDTRPESDPKPTQPENPKAPVEPVKPAQPENPVEPAEPEKPKTNTYSRVSIFVTKGNVISAFSNNGGEGKLNLIVDSISGNTYTCHDKAGNSYSVVVTNQKVSFNGETYTY